MRKDELIDKIITILITYLFNPSYNEENMIDVMGDERIYNGLKYYGLDKNDYLFEDCVKKDNLVYYLLWDKVNKRYELYWTDYDGTRVMLRRNLMLINRISDMAIFLSHRLNGCLKDILIQSLYQYIIDNHIFGVKAETSIFYKFNYDFNSHLFSFYDLNRNAYNKSRFVSDTIRWLCIICTMPIATKSDILNAIHEKIVNCYTELNEKIFQLRRTILEINKL